MRTDTLQKFTSGVKKTERTKAIPKGYISEQDLSELIYGKGDRVSFGQKIIEGKKRYSKELARLAKLLTPVEGKQINMGMKVRYYKKTNFYTIKKINNYNPKYKKENTKKYSR